MALSGTFTDDESFVQAAWYSWTPTYANLTIGNATVVAKYVQVGKLVTLKLRVVLGTTSTMGTTPTFTLPVTATSDLTGDDTYGTFNGQILDSGTARFDLIGTVNNTTTGSFAVRNTSSTYGGFSGITSLVPMTWTTGDTFYLTGTYEAA